jgi:hypothetical protein
LRGGDPAPGDDDAITTVICHLREVSATAGDAVVLLGRIGSDVDLWTGPAAEACGRRRDELVRRLQAAQSAYTDAADTLARWLVKLQPLQVEAAQIAWQAARMEQSAQADGTLSVFASPATPAVPGLERLQRQHDDVRERATAAARICAQELDRATNLVKQFKHSDWENLSDFLHDAHDVLGTAVFALTIATAFMPALAPVLMAGKLTLIAVDVLKLGVDVKLVADGDKGWGTVAGDAFDLTVDVAGAGFGGMAKAARAEDQLRAGAAAAEKSAAELANAVDPALREAGRISAANATRFADHAHTAAGKLAAGFTGAARREILHPVETLKRDREMADVVKHAEAYAKLPPLRQWLPPGHGHVVLADTGVKILEANEARENITKWISGIKR